MIAIDLGRYLSTTTSDRLALALSRAGMSSAFCQFRTESERDGGPRRTAPPPATTPPNGASGSAARCSGNGSSTSAGCSTPSRSSNGPLPREVILIGKGRGGLVAALRGGGRPAGHEGGRDRTRWPATSPTSPTSASNLGLMAPGILREVGDVAQIAALIAPRRWSSPTGVAGGGTALTPTKLRDAYREATPPGLLGAGGKSTSWRRGIETVVRSLAPWTAGPAPLGACLPALRQTTARYQRVENL